MNDLATNPQETDENAEPLSLTIAVEDCAESAWSEREADRLATINWFENPWHILNAYLSHPRVRSNPRSILSAIRAMELALGYTLAAGGEGPSECARLSGVSKAAFGATVNHFITQLRLSKLPGQRDDHARAAMATARKAQVK